MVTCILQGGMANQFFTTLATIAYARKHKMQYRIPTKTNNPRWKHYTFDNVGYEDIDTTSFYKYQSPDIRYDERPYDVSYHEIPYHENIVLEGHFQSWKYFDGIIYPPRYFYEIVSMPFTSGMCAIHVRRGDYLTMADKLPPVTEKYLKNAADYIVQLGVKEFNGYSDDIPWLKNEFNNQLGGDWISDPPFFVMSSCHSEISNSEIIDLRRIASTKYIIGSNSSYSLMAYYLNPHWDKKIILPKVWFGPGYGPVDCTDLYPPDCIVL